jgi:hypothetical protein
MGLYPSNAHDENQEIQSLEATEAKPSSIGDVSVYGTLKHGTHQ